MLRTRLNSTSWFIFRVPSMVLLTIFATLLGGAVTFAQSQPFISAVEPKSGPAGTVIAIDGGGFTPGNYDGSLLWNGEPVGRLTFLDGTFFNVPLVVPPFTAPGQHEITVCAGYPCFTGDTAQSARSEVTITDPMPVAEAQIAYVFVDDREGVEVMRQYADLLNTYGIAMKAVPMDQITEIEPAEFDLVIVAANTGDGERWGDSSQSDLLAKAPRILALGNGGHALFGKITPALGFPNGEVKPHPGTVTLPNPALSFAKTPHNFQGFVQRSIPIFAEGIEKTSINIPKPPSSAVRLAYTAVLGDPTNESVILSEGCRTLWGFNLPPGQLAPAGRALFANTVFFALGAACDFDFETGCSLLTSPTAIPSGVTIDFDEWPTATVLGDLYLNSLGVRFEDTQTHRAITYADNPNDVGKSNSPPNVATNSALFPNTSSGVPMRIDVPPGRSHVGFRLGNGKDATGAGPDLSALITALDVNDAVLCRYSVSPVPASHTLFAGIYDAQSRIAAVTIDYGDTLLSEAIDDFVLAPALFAEEIRLCRGTAAECDPVADAEVHVLRNGLPTGTVLGSDENGYLLGREQVQFGDDLWARVFVNATQTYSTYHTSGAPARVSLSAFDQQTGMTLGIGAPLLVHNLTFATQWDLTTDTAYTADLVQRIIEASNHFYDFTDGQMALGNVTIYQNYDEWNNADVRIYASNVMRPQAEIGGSVTVQTPDPLVPDLDYYPGYVYMGSSWHRTGAPVTAGGIDPDWSLALAHELGHYLLFLYDTYLSLNENNEAVEIDTCIGSAMGWAYEEENTELVFDSAHWNTYCADTLANQTLGRTEWATMKMWYDGLSIPTFVNPGPPAPPVPLTNVAIMPPSTRTLPVTNQLFALAYQNQETPSKAARGWLISNQRVLDQGRPISGTNTISLNNAQVGDRFCFFDIGDETSPRQFGCEQIEDGDNTLILRKDSNWAPVIQVSPINTQTIAISVTQTITDPYDFKAIIYPEDETVATTITMSLDGDVYTGVFNSPIAATSAYVMVHVDEPFDETSPRREAIVGYGVGGSGAFGPASRLGGVPIISEDGRSEFAFGQNTTLSEDEFVLWQSMAGSPGDSANLIGTSYRLLAVPPSLAEKGSVAIRLPDTPPPTRLGAARNTTEVEATPQIHFSTGTEWVPLPSREIIDPQGGAKVIAPSRGVGVYALLAPVQTNNIFLPAIQR